MSRIHMGTTTLLSTATFQTNGMKSNMLNSDHQGAPMSPRISFSNDFVINPSAAPPATAPADPNFEFSVGSRPMMAADELFFKGRMLPLRAGSSAGTTTTLRDELRTSEGRQGARPPRGSSALRWREMLGFRKKNDKAEGPSEPVTEANASSKS